jgi:2-dehydropantoate 2-reductase
MSFPARLYLSFYAREYPLKVLIVGAEAIGSLMAYRLAVAGHDVTAVGSGAFAQAVAQRGLLVEQNQKVLRAPQIKAVSSIESLAETDFELVLITTKAFDTAVAAVQVQRFARQGATLLVLQNGVGGVDVAVGLLGPERLYAGITTMPVQVLRPALLRLLESRGGLGLAAVDSAQELDLLAQLFVKAGLKTQIYEDCLAMQWSKLTLSMLANAIPAILDWPLDKILADPRLYQLERDAVCEAWAVVQRLKLRLVSLPGYPVPQLVRGLCTLPPKLAYPVFRRAILHRRGGRSSPLQHDLQKGRLKSEVTFLNGAVARAGAQAGVPTPINRALDDVLTALARKEIEWSEYQGQPERLVRRAQGGQ